MGMDVFLLAGQSNMLSGRDLVPALDWNGWGVFQIGRHGSQDGVLISGSEPLHHNETAVRDTSIGPAVAFARLHYRATGRAVLLAPAARGSTGLSFSGANLPISWNRTTGGLYQEAVATANAAMALASGSRFAGILWSQGEANSNLTEAQYATLLDDMIAGFRADIDGATSSTPFVLGGMVPDWADDNATGVRAAHVDTPSRVPFTAYADPTTPTRLERTSDNDLIHFDAVEQRNAMGERFFNAFQTIVG